MLISALAIPTISLSHADVACMLGRSLLRKAGDTAKIRLLLEVDSPAACKVKRSPTSFVTCGTEKPQNMRSKVWLAYAVLFGSALSAAPPRAQREDSLATSALKLISPSNFSDGTTNTSLFNNSLHRLSNYSAFPPNLPFGYDLPENTDTVPHCNGAVYGSDLDRSSCFDAWRNMGFGPKPVSWGPRGTGHNFKYKLPFRWSSG